jgi:hypothetical protein
VTEWNLTKKFVQDLSETYDTVDVSAECRKALMWIRTNMHKRKTAGGMPKFLNSWLSRSANSGVCKNQKKKEHEYTEPEKPSIERRIAAYRKKHPEDPEDYMLNQIADPWEIAEYRDKQQRMRAARSACRASGSPTKLVALMQPERESS